MGVELAVGAVAGGVAADGAGEGTGGNDAVAGVLVACANARFGKTKKGLAVPRMSAIQRASDAMAPEA